MVLLTLEITYKKLDIILSTEKSSNEETKAKTIL